MITKKYVLVSQKMQKV